MTKNNTIKAVICLLLVAAIATATYSWFFQNEMVTVEFGSDITCEAGQNLEISMDDGQTFSGSVNISNPYQMLDISGDGLNLYAPINIDENAAPTGYKPAEAATPNESGLGVGHYIELRLTFRSLSKMNVYLNSSSFVNPKNTNNTSIYGFSRDYIAGAMRIAFIDLGPDTQDPQNDIKMVWVPNPNYHLTKSQHGKYSFSPNGTRETEYKYCTYIDGAYEIVAYNSDDYADKRIVHGSTGTTSTSSGSSACLFELNPTPGEYAYNTILVRIWFEGTDREASEALAGGNINVKLQFAGLSKLQPTQDMIKNINSLSIPQSSYTIQGIKDGMYYSINGYNWIACPLSGEGLITASQSFVYIKYAETDDYYETRYRKITR